MALTETPTDLKLITSTFESYWFEPDIFYIRVYSDSVLDLADVEKMHEFQTEQNVGLAHKRLVHAEKYATITKDAREFIQDNTPAVKAGAYILHSLPQRILYNIYVKLRRHKNPSKAFDNPEDAIAWLRAQ